MYTSRASFCFFVFCFCFCFLFSLFSRTEIDFGGAGVGVPVAFLHLYLSLLSFDLRGIHCSCERRRKKEKEKILRVVIDETTKRPGRTKRRKRGRRCTITSDSPAVGPCCSGVETCPTGSQMFPRRRRSVVVEKERGQGG